MIGPEYDALNLSQMCTNDELLKYEETRVIA